jgi:hypothetical protein
MEKTYVNLYIPCNIFCFLYLCAFCFAVDETSPFEPKAKNTFPLSVCILLCCGRNFSFSYTTKHENFLFPTKLFLIAEASVFYVWYDDDSICLNECLWMQMTWCNVSCKWIAEHIFKHHNYSLSSPWEWFKSFCRLLFGFTVYFSVYQRWLFV